MNELHIFFLPHLAQGHTIPTLEMEKLFISRGVKTSILITPKFVKPVQNLKDLGFNIDIHLLKFPPENSELPDEIKSFDQIHSDDMFPLFIKALDLLQEPVEKLLEEFHPDCLVVDMFFKWASEVATKFHIPRLMFHGTCYLAMCVSHSMKIYQPYKNVSSDCEEFVLPNLPHELRFARTRDGNDAKETENDITKIFKRIEELDRRSYGVLFNNFYEFEPDYANHYKKVLGRKAWNIGPLFLCNKWGRENESHRGKESANAEQQCFKWLDSQEPNSVVYIWFGSIATFTAKQIHEIAMGLEISTHKFIWVVQKGKNKNENDKESLLPDGFEQRMKDKGLVIKGWASQLVILENKAIGAFVTHCGWNSMLEGACLGVPMITWPLFADQFYNEKL